ncbi:CBS domain-containing protein [Actinosynnema sp. NPDC051121]
MRARDIMTSPVITVSSTEPLREAAALMTAHGFTALPVVDGGRLVGIVTEADLLRGRYGAVPEALDAPVAEVLTTPVYGMDPAAPAELLARVMVDDRVRCIPIVDGSRVVGVVTRRDLVRVLTRTDDVIAADVRRRLAVYREAVHWTVSVDDGDVTIGTVGDDAEVDRLAAALAESVPGVVAVHVRPAHHGGAR